MEVGDALLQFSLLFMRGLGVIALLPFGRTIVGTSQRTFLAAGLAILFFDPLALPQSVTPAGLLAEFVIGVLISVPAVMVISCVSMCGELIDSGRGQTIGLLYSPLSGHGASSTSMLGSVGIWAFLLFFGILETLMSGLVSSIALLPLGSFAFTELDIIGRNLLAVIEPILSLTFSFYFPFAILFLVIDLGFGFVAKLTPQANPYSEAIQLKTYVAFAMLALLTRYDLGFSMSSLALPELEIFSR